MSYSQEDLKRALDRAKIKLLKHPNSSFVATILFSCSFHWDMSIPTAATDGFDLWVNPDYFMDLDEDERVGLLAHESWHPAFNHMARGRDLNHDRYNDAADYVINDMLIKAQYKLPKGALLNKKFAGMSTKQIYDLLPEPPPGKGGTQPDGSGIGRDIKYDKSAKQSKAKQTKLTKTLIKAVTQAKINGDDPGEIPGSIRRQIDDIINPVLPWRTLLANYFSEFDKSDYSWKKPNFKYFPEMYMPSMYGESIGHLAFAVDTSGSVTKEEFTAIVSELDGIKENLKPELMTILDFDTTIKKEHIVDSETNLSSIVFEGHGGTKIKPVWDWAKKNTPLVLVILSDMQFVYPTDEPGCPILWICVNNESVGDMPFGDTIHMETKHD